VGDQQDEQREEDEGAERRNQRAASGRAGPQAAEDSRTALV
jgi:hypothetical protein